MALIDVRGMAHLGGHLARVASSLLQIECTVIAVVLRGRGVCTMAEEAVAWFEIRIAGVNPFGELKYASTIMQ